MKNSISKQSLLAPLLLALSTSYSTAATASAGFHVPSTQTFIEHSGGCRKASPPGQCCHAGSQPYHCH